MTFYSMAMERRALNRADGQLGMVRCTTDSHLVIPRNATRVVRVVVDIGVKCTPRSTILQSMQKTVLPDGVAVTPLVINYNPSIQGVDVEISNPTDSTVIFQPHALLCELQEVQLEEGLPDSKKVHSQQNSEGSSEAFLAHFNLQGTDLDDHQLAQAENLLVRYRDVFSEGPFDIGHTHVAKHSIKLTDETPFKQRHHYIPPSMYQEVRDHLQQLMKKDYH